MTEIVKHLAQVREPRAGLPAPQWMRCFIHKTPHPESQPVTGPKADLGLDLDLLATHLKEKMRAENLSLRPAASQIGLSAATLSRMLAGSRTGTFPEGKNLVRAVTWLGKSLNDFESARRPSETTIADVEVHLRALPGLDNRDVEALVALVRAAHEKGLELQSKKP